VLLFAEYFLEDCIEMLNFVPPHSQLKKHKEKRNNNDDEEAIDLAVSVPDIFGLNSKIVVSASKLHSVDLKPTGYWKLLADIIL